MRHEQSRDAITWYRKPNDKVEQRKFSSGPATAACDVRVSAGFEQVLDDVFMLLFYRHQERCMSFKRAIIYWHSRLNCDLNDRQVADVSSSV